MIPILLQIFDPVPSLPKHRTASAIHFVQGGAMVQRSLLSFPVVVAIFWYGYWVFRGVPTFGLLRA